MELTNVSTVLIVSDKAIIIINADKKGMFSFKRIEKKARSGFILLSRDIAINPETPIKKTIGIIIKKENQRLCFNTFSFLAANTLC